MAHDQACNMTVDERRTETNEDKGKTCFFCAAGCKETFEKEPEKYVETPA